MQKAHRIQNKTVFILNLSIILFLIFICVPVMLIVLETQQNISNTIEVCCDMEIDSDIL